MTPFSNFKMATPSVKPSTGIAEHRAWCDARVTHPCPWPQLDGYSHFMQDKWRSVTVGRSRSWIRPWRTLKEWLEQLELKRKLVSNPHSFVVMVSNWDRLIRAKWLDDQAGERVGLIFNFLLKRRARGFWEWEWFQDNIRRCLWWQKVRRTGFMKGTQAAGVSWWKWLIP